MSSKKKDGSKKAASKETNALGKPIDDDGAVNSDQPEVPSVQQVNATNDNQPPAPVEQSTMMIDTTDGGASQPVT